ncbi:MAG: hypothetical protein HFH08_05770, partial [Bacilli bacterium]|nr:hypothetical protein [Bacilli bacterium]
FGRFINADRLLGPGNDLAYNLYLYCGNNPVSRVDEDGNWFFGVVAKGIKAVAKPALKAADKMVKGARNCIGAVFGAGASVSNTQPIDGPTASAFGVSVSVGGAVNTPSLSVGSSNKPISGYYSQTNNDANIGINLNFGYFKETINVGYDDISISYGIYSNREKTKFNEFKLGASIKQFTFFAQGNYNLANSDGSSTDTYARVDVNAWIPITVFAGGPIVRSVAAALQGRGALVPAY